MELLRRALLVGCVLPGLWLLRLSPLDPILSIVPHDFAALQKQEAAAIPDARKTEAQRRMAEIPLSVYVEEVLKYNVFSATGAEWEAYLANVDRRAQSGGSPNPVFARPDAAPLRDVEDKLAAGGGTTYVSLSRPGGDVHYQVVRHNWTRRDFEFGRGFTGRPAPPAQLLYPFRTVGYLAVAVGAALFLLWPPWSQAGALVGVAPREIAGLAIGLAAFIVPLVAVGGSVPALTGAPLVTLACWLVTLAGVHVFASPTRTAPDPVAVSTAAGTGGARAALRHPVDAVYLRQGLVFLVMALGPAAFLVAVSVTLWNR